MGAVLTGELARLRAAGAALAHLWLVPNPAHKPQGDFAIGADGEALNDAPPGGTRHTFSTIALYRRALFEPPWCDILPGNPQGTAAPLAPLLLAVMVFGSGLWMSVSAVLPPMTEMFDYRWYKPKD